MAALPQAFSKEALPAQAVPEGSGKWWGRLLVKNTGTRAVAFTVIPPQVDRNVIVIVIVIVT